MRIRLRPPLVLAGTAALSLFGCQKCGGRMTYEIHRATYAELGDYLSTRAEPRRFLLPAAPEIPEEFGSHDFNIEGMCDCAYKGRIGSDEMESHRAAEDCRYFAMWQGPRLSLSALAGYVSYAAFPMDEEIELPTDRTEEGLLEWSKVRLVSDNPGEFEKAVEPMLLKQIEDSIAMLEVSS